MRAHIFASCSKNISQSLRLPLTQARWNGVIPLLSGQLTDDNLLLSTYPGAWYTASPCCEMKWCCAVGVFNRWVSIIFYKRFDSLETVIAGKKRPKPDTLMKLAMYSNIYQAFFIFSPTSLVRITVVLARGTRSSRPLLCDVTLDFVKKCSWKTI